MARIAALVQDSDEEEEELPDLATLAKTSKSRPKVTAAARGTASARAKAQARTSKSVSRDVESESEPEDQNQNQNQNQKSALKEREIESTRLAGDESSERVSKGSETGNILSEPKKTRKRVLARNLNQKSDNPLLRRLDSSESTRRASPFSGVRHGSEEAVGGSGGGSVGARPKEVRSQVPREKEIEKETGSAARSGVQTKVASGSEKEKENGGKRVVPKRKETRIPPSNCLNEKPIVQSTRLGSEDIGGVDGLKKGKSRRGSRREEMEPRTVCPDPESLTILNSKKSRDVVKHLDSQKTIVSNIKLDSDSETETGNLSDFTAPTRMEPKSRTASVEPETNKDVHLPSRKNSSKPISEIKPRSNSSLEIDSASEAEPSDSPATKKRSTKSRTASIESEDDEDVKLAKRKDSSKDSARSKPNSRIKNKPSPKIDSESESDISEGDLSDFIVNDSTFLDDGESVLEIPPPKSGRRLVQGRRPRRCLSDDEDDDTDLGLRMGKLKIDVGDEAQGKADSWDKGLKDLVDEFGEDEDDIPVLKLPKKSIEKPKGNTKTSLPDRKTTQPPPSQENISRPATSSSSIDNPFTLRFSPPTNARPTTKTTRFTTPPGTPPLSPSKPRGLISPSKPRLKIPATPHRQSTDAFWAQDVINDWNDAYSPVKPILPVKPRLDSLSPTKTNPALAPQLKAAKAAKKTFEAEKYGIAERFLKELDDAITGGKVGKLAASTGGVRIVWSNKLNTTAGRANWKRETIRTTSAAPSASTSQTQIQTQKPGQEQTTSLTYRHHASIELASKVISTRARLLNVIAHEYCHLANFMISNIKTNPHGKEFKIWARRVTEWGQKNNVCHRGPCSKSGVMSRVIGGDGCGGGGADGMGQEEEEEVFEVTTKHSYEIEYKFIWECGGCGVLYKRHSKSVDPTRHQCGTCRGRLVQVKPVPRGGGGAAAGSAGRTGDDAGVGGNGNGGGGAGGGKRELSAYQLFVKNNMAVVKKELPPGSPQKDVMGEVGRRYRALKAESQSAPALGPNLSGEVGLSEVVRGLDFLDLSGESPWLRRARG